MKLFLTSSGLSPKIEQALLDLLRRDPNDLRMAFVSTATKGDNPLVPLTALHEALKANEDYQDLARLGFKIDFVDLEDQNEDTIVSAFAPYQVIYIYGGNTFYLMDHANRSGFKKHVREILEGKVYVGVSAGSVIAGPDIELAGWEHGDPNNIDLQDMSGLSLVPFCILPHWNGLVSEETAGYAYEVVYIKDGESLADES